jgi:uncharacterized membrane protein
MKRIALLYILTFAVILPLDFLFLGVLAKDFFRSQVGDMLGDLKIVPGMVFYLVYVVGILIFVNGSDGATWRHAALYGALFGFFAYATFDLTCLAVLRHWSWTAAGVDITWGAFVTATSATIGLSVTDWLLGRS